MKKSTDVSDRTIREGFEANYQDHNLEVYTDLECLLLGVPAGTYKSETTQMAWIAWNPWMERTNMGR